MNLWMVKKKRKIFNNKRDILCLIMNKFWFFTKKKKRKRKYFGNCSSHSIDWFLFIFMWLLLHQYVFIFIKNKLVWLTPFVFIQIVIVSIHRASPVLTCFIGVFVIRTLSYLMVSSFLYIYFEIFPLFEFFWKWFKCLLKYSNKILKKIPVLIRKFHSSQWILKEIPFLSVLIKQNSFLIM